MWFSELVTAHANGGKVLLDEFHLSWIWLETDRRRFVTSRGDCKATLYVLY